MNERIRELALTIPRIKDFYEVGPVQRASVEEFVELIVKECARLQHVRFCQEGDVSWDMLMRHFGIKE